MNHFPTIDDLRSDETLHKGRITWEQIFENNIVILKTHQFVGGQKVEDGRREDCMVNWLTSLTERKGREMINLPEKIIKIWRFFEGAFSEHV